MKDVSLSLLSRGCGRFSSNKITGRHSGRLDVCLTPQDYYIWKSQNSLLQLSSRGCVLMEAESTLPKTFSTRRGPLLLYSQDLVSLETSCHSKTRDRKQQVAQQCTQQVEQQLSTLKELTASISGNSNNQFTSSRPGRPFFPPLSLPLAPDVRHLSPPLTCTMRQQSSPEHLVQMNPQRFPAEKNTERVENQPEDKEVEQGNKKRVRLGLFLQIPCTSTAPQMESQPWTHYVAITPEEETQTHLDKRLQHTESSRHAEINHHSMRGELHHPDRNCVHDMAIDHCSIQDSEATSDKGNCGRVMSANGHGNIGLLPPLTEGQSVSHGPCWEKTGKARWEGPSSDEHHAQRLPPIVKSRTVVPGQAIPAQTQRDAQPKAERVGFQSPENLNQVHQQPLFLPLLFPGKDEEIHEKQRQGKEQKERQHLKKKTGRGRGLGGARELSEKGSLVLLEELPRPVGVLGCVAGWKGPGKQSSLAFLQNQLLDLQDSCQSSNDNRSVVRGILPLELRDLQNGKSVGSLILGPDGEIIQLSVYHNSQEPSQGDGGRQEQVLQVLSADGEKSPWVIVLQPEHTHTVCAEEGMGLNTDPEGDIQQHQSRHKLLDLRRSRESHTPSSQTDPVAVAKKKTKNAEAVTETWKASKEGAKKNVWMLPLREQVGQEGPRGGNDEAEEEDKEGALGSTEQTSHLSGLHQPGEKLQFKDDVLCSKQNINSNDATVEDAVDKKWKNTKRKDTEEATVTTGTTNMKTVTSAESDGQKTLRRRKEGRWLKQKTGNGAQSMRSQKQEERTTRDSTEAQHQSALPSKNKMTDREGEREVKMMNEEKEERGEMMRQKEESAGRRRRGRLKYEEAVVGNLKDNLKEKLQVENNQEVEKEPHLKSTTSPSATQRHNNKTKTNSEKGTDYLFNNGDKYSSVGSVWSLGSTASASQFNHRRLRRSAASSCEGAVPASPVGLVSSHSCLSSCSTVMVMEEKLMLNPVKSESSRPRKSQEEEATALHLAQQEERKLQEVKKKRREQEEKERAHTEEKMKNELEEERSKRAEELRLKKLAEEEERREREEEEQDQARQEQAQRERERRRKEERKRQMERLQRMREEEEQRRKAELECLHLEEERRQEEESKKLQGMDENERIEYLSRKKQEKDDRRNKEEERKRAEEEAALWAAEEARLQAQILARQMALLQQQLAFKRGLVLEAGGLEKTQGISRPWITSYFTLLQLLGLNPKKAETITP